MSPATAVREARTEEVWARLASVTDPELDESVTELGFVTAVEVRADGRVRIAFRLPTYWCAANFAFLMADDMRRAVTGLPWAKAIELELRDHMYAEAISEGITRGRSFGETFGDEADGSDLEEVRRTFRRKAFQGRQDLLIRHLLGCGHDGAAIAAMSLAGLGALAIADPEGRVLRARYLEIRAEWGGPAGPADPAFVSAEGRPLDPGTLGAYLRDLQRVRINAEFNGALCRGLLRARYGADESGEPTLWDFAVGAVPGNRARPAPRTAPEEATRPARRP